MTINWKKIKVAKQDDPIYKEEFTILFCSYKLFIAQYHQEGTYNHSQLNLKFVEN